MKTPPNSPKNRAILDSTPGPIEPTPEPVIVTVRCREPLHEGGHDFAKGALFETTARRAAALGSLVEPA